MTTALAAAAILPIDSNAVPPVPSASAAWALLLLRLLIFASFFPVPPLDTSSTDIGARSSCDNLGIAASIRSSSGASGDDAPAQVLPDRSDIALTGRCLVWSEDDGTVGGPECVLPFSGGPGCVLPTGRPSEPLPQLCHKSHRAATSAMTSFSHRSFLRTVSEKARAEATVEHLPRTDQGSSTRVMRLQIVCSAAYRQPKGRQA